MAIAPREFPPGKALTGLATEAEEGNLRALEGEAQAIVDQLKLILAQAQAQLALITITTSGGIQGGGSVAEALELSLADGGVTTAKIADGGVTGAKLENSGVAAGTYASPTSITVDAKGRITSIT